SWPHAGATPRWCMAWSAGSGTDRSRRVNSSILLGAHMARAMLLHGLRGEERRMDRVRFLAVGVLGGLLAACSGAPSGDAPDYEVDLVGEPAGSSPGDGAGSESAYDQGAEGDDYDGRTPSGPAAGGSGDPDAEQEEPDAPPPPPPPSTATVKVNGTTRTVTEVKLWSEVSGPGEYNVFVKVTGPG